MTTYAILIKPLVANTGMRPLTRTEVNRLRALGVASRGTWAVTSDGQVWEPCSTGGYNSVWSVRVCNA
jgi:hypothetical protein